MASKLLLIIVFVLDVIAFGLAIAAEQRRSTAVIKLDADGNYSYCFYDSAIATGYGVGALLLFLASQVVIMVATQCFTCGKTLKPSGSRTWAAILFIICWVFLTMGEICLMAGSVRNAYHTKHRSLYIDEPPFCETLRKGVFAAGAVFIFFNCLVSMLYYVFFSKAKKLGFQFGEAIVCMTSSEGTTTYYYNT